jgi:hypothetical protein
MAQRTVRGSQRSIASIDGFAEPIDRAPDGSVEPETGNAEPGRPVETFGGIPAAFPDELIDGGISGDGFPSGRSKRRGRPLGSKNAPKQGAQNIAEHLESLLLSVHLMGAAFFGTPELALDPEEATKLSDAIKNVAQYYPVVFDPKKLAIANLGIVLMTTYGTRGVAIYKRMRDEEPKKPKPAPTPIRAEQPKPSQGLTGPQAGQPEQMRMAQTQPQQAPLDFRVHTTMGVNDEHISDV